MAGQWGNVSRKSLMENITLLWSLSEIIELPRENKLRESKESWRQLSIEQEKTVADVVAFLSATHDDNSKITAVCIEEARDHNHLLIRIASNTGDCSYVTNGLEEMAKTLERASRRVNTKEDDYFRLLQCIVRVDQPKIMCRLRSRHASRTRKTVNKRSPVIHLREALHEQDIRPSEAVTQPDLNRLRARAQELEALFIEFESTADRGVTNDESLEKLLEIVQTAESFASSSLDRMVTAFQSSRLLDPSTKVYLPIAITKLARYSSASRYLVATARKKRYSVFNNIKVDPVQIPHPSQPLFQGPFPTLEQAGRNVVSTSFSAQGRQKMIPIVAFLGQSYHDKAKAFQAHVCSESNVWKVHAEIQLLIHHELNPSIPKPRIIASSKSACYLCNLFISLHHQFQVPRTHGRIYDRWVLPDWVSFTKTQRHQMNLTVEKLNISILKTIADTVQHCRMSRNHPNESVVFSVKQLSSSTLSVLQLATPLPTPVGSRTSLHNQIMQVKSAQNSSSRLPILPMDAISEDQNLGTSTVMPACAEEQISSGQRNSLVLSSSDSTEKVTSIIKGTTSVNADVDNESNHVIEEEEAEASVVQGQSSTSSILSTSHSTSEATSRDDTDRSHPQESLHIDDTQTDLGASVRASTDIGTSQHTLTHPGQAVSGRLTLASTEIHVEAGKLHLTLSREHLPGLGTQHSAECIINVRWLNVEEGRTLMAANHSGEVVNVQDMAEGEMVTVNRGGWLSDNDLVLSWGRESLISIKYWLEGFRETRDSKLSVG